MSAAMTAAVAGRRRRRMGWNLFERPYELNRPAALPLVQAVEELRVLVVDHVALDLERGRQLAGLLREVVVEDLELLDLRDLRVVGVDVVEDALDELAHLLVLGQLGDVLGQALLLGPGDDLLLVERDERDRVRPAVAVHHGLRAPARLLEVVPHVRRREVLAARRDDDVLHPAGDLHEPLVVDLADIAGAEPAVVGERLARGLLVAPVLLEDVRALHQQLALVADLDLDPGDGLPDGAEVELVRRVNAADADGLGQAPALQHRNATGVEEREDVGRDRRGAGDRLLDLAAEGRADVLVELLLELLEGLAGLGTSLADLHPALDGLGKRVLVAVRGDERVYLLEDPRDAREVRRLGLRQLRDDLLRVAAEVDDGRADVDGAEHADEREDVRHRQVEVGDVVARDEVEVVDDRADRA